MIDKLTVDKIYETARIEEVIGEFVNLKKSGSNFKGLSPFTEEKTPSFFVSPSKQIFKCFSSGKGGNVVRFLMEHEHMSYPEALRFLADKYGIEIEEEEQSPEQLEAQNERESLYVVTQFAATYFEDQLHNSEEGKAIGLSYFQERGFSQKTITKFNLGYNPDQWSALTDAALEKGYKEEFLSACGLVKRNSKDKLYDGYKGRVIFPILNLSGRAIGFGGRTLKSDKKIPKYINSPENLIYDKSNVLYGLYQAKSHIIKEDVCYLVEGYTDVISLSQAGVENVVSSSGTSLTTGQIRLISRYSKNITILYDGDAAGIKASFRGINLILEQGLNVRVVLFPENEDPDSYSQKLSTEAFQTYLADNAQDFIAFKADALMKDIRNDPLRKSEAVRDIIESIALIPDHITRSVYLKESSSLLEVEEQALLNEMNKMRRKNVQEQARRSRSEHPTEVQQQPDNDFPTSPSISQVDIRNAEFQEKDVIRILLNYGEQMIELKSTSDTGEQELVETSLANYMLSELLEDDIQFKDETFQLIVDAYIELINQEEEVNHAFFTNHTNEAIASTATDLLTFPYDLHHWERKEIYVKSEDAKLLIAARGAIYSLKTKRVHQLIQENQERMKEAHIKGEDISPLLKAQLNLDRIKRELSKEQGITIIK